MSSNPPDAPDTGELKAICNALDTDVVGTWICTLPKGHSTRHRGEKANGCHYWGTETPVISRSDSGELERALANVVTHARALVVSEWASGHASEVQAQLLATARQSVLDLFERLQKENEREERAASQLLDERDAAEEALSQAYFLITGRSPEWSNLFGYREALDEVDNAQELLRDEIASLRSTALTPEEAYTLLPSEERIHIAEPSGLHFSANPNRRIIWLSAISKLRSLSSLRSSSLGEQNDSR